MEFSTSDIQTEVPMKTCSKCGESKPATDEHFVKRRPHLFRTECRKCFNKQMAANKRRREHKSSQVCNHCGIEKLYTSEFFVKYGRGLTKRCIECKIKYGMKTCTMCGETKPANEDHFYIRRDRGDGLYFNSRCIICCTRESKKAHKTLSLNNPLVKRGEIKICTKCLQAKPATVEYFHKKLDGVSSVCKECALKEKKEYARINHETIKVRQREYHKTDAWKETRNAYFSRAEVRERRRLRNREYHRNRKVSDPVYKVSRILRSRMNKTIVKGQKSESSMELIGCTPEQARLHIESLFIPGMSWGNHGEWEIDHIVPCASFDLTDPLQQRQCFHYSNLQPLWASDNRRKRDKTPDNHQMALPL